MEFWGMVLDGLAGGVFVCGGLHFLLTLFQTWAAIRERDLQLKYSLELFLNAVFCVFGISTGVILWLFVAVMRPAKPTASDWFVMIVCALVSFAATVAARIKIQDVLEYHAYRKEKLRRAKHETGSHAA